MNYVLLQQALLSFVVGAGFVVLVTVLAEKGGSKIGGIVSGMPGTVMISLLFIGIHHGADFAAEAAAVVPAVLGAICVFLTSFASLPRIAFLPRLATAVGLWLCLSYLVVVSGFSALSHALILLLVVGAACFYLMEQVLSIPSAPAIQISYSKNQLSIRALFAGLAVMTALIVSKFAGPIWGGVASAFPIANCTSFVILQDTAGLDFTRAMSKAAVVSVVCNSGIYVALAHLTYPVWGLALGTTFSLFAASLSTYGTYYFLRNRVV